MPGLQLRVYKTSIRLRQTPLWARAVDERLQRKPSRCDAGVSDARNNHAAEEVARLEFSQSINTPLTCIH